MQKATIYTHIPDVAGSNPAFATIKKPLKQNVSGGSGFCENKLEWLVPKRHQVRKNRVCSSD
jgi:hypothetical protein